MTDLGYTLIRSERWADGKWTFVLEKPDMKLFYVEAVIEKTPYDCATETFDYRNVVWAENEDMAYDKVHDHWEAKCESYGVSYYVKDCDVKESL